MAYCTRQDIETLYSRELVDSLGDHSGDGTDSSIAARVDAAIEAAHGIIDAYLTTRYALPIANPPQILKQLAIDIVVYRLALYPGTRTEEMRKRYEDAVAFLKQLSTGIAALPVVTSALLAAESPNGVPNGTVVPGDPNATPQTRRNFKNRILSMDTGNEVPRVRRACDCWEAAYYGAKPCSCSKSLLHGSWLTGSVNGGRVAGSDQNAQPTGRPVSGSVDPNDFPQ